MFWGITLDVGKRYTQTVEKSFHLSMAALGFNNTTADPVTIMVEVDKAQFALCTLQPGKIPQQTLDIAFTEGEEITFFTEGNNEVHLTGYLVEEPETIEMEDEEFSLDSEESVSGSEESESDSNEGEEEEEEDASSSSEVVTLQHLLVGENVSDDDDQSDNDWDPSKDNPTSKGKRKSPKKNKKKGTQNDESKEQNVSNGTAKQQAEGLTEFLLNDSLAASDDESDDYIPEKKKKDKETTKKLNPKKKGKKRKLKESSDTNMLSQRNESEKGKKSIKRTSKVGSDS